ncbi:hypothetical protein AB0G73_10580 [Streptomyces sp. NPDC020719]|uniref:hypothetical protein n=1 Tax=Streptomyces sp. NPDC020719 TaxID=3154896 RepID=UPI0033FE126C
MTMLVCDVCERRDRAARKYTLTVGGAEPVRKDLCAEDAEPVLALFFGDTAVAPAAEGVSVESLVAAAPVSTAASVSSENVPVEERPEPAPAPAKKAAAAKKAMQRPTAAKKTVTRKAAAKKTAAPRKRGLGAKATTLEEIEAKKRPAGQA